MWIFQYLKSMGDNFGKVTAKIYRGAEPSAARLLHLKHEIALEAVLNLRADVKDEERAEVEAAGMLWCPVPMKDDEAPTDQQIMKALDVMRSGLVTLVQCKGGRHRTGVIVAVYRVVEQGWTKDAAWKEAYDYGFYRHGGHGVIEDWFLNDFKPESFKARANER